MNKESTVLLMFLSFITFLVGGGGFVLSLTAFFYLYEHLFGDQVRKWWKGVKRRAVVNKHYKDRAKRYEQRLKDADEWQH